MNNEVKRLVLRVRNEADEWLRVVDSIGNECAMTDDILSDLLTIADRLKETDRKRFGRKVESSRRPGRMLKEDSTSERINRYGNGDKEANYVLKIDGAEYGYFEDYEDAVNAAEDARYNGEDGVEVINVATGKVVYSSDEMGLTAVLDYIDEELYDMGIRTTEEAWEYLHDWVDRNARDEDDRPDKNTILQIADELKRRGLVESRRSYR